MLFMPEGLPWSDNLANKKSSEGSLMSDAAANNRAWCEAFASLYADHTRCSATDARYIARMLHPVLGQLPPAQALRTVTSDPAFVDETDKHHRRRSSK